MQARSPCALVRQGAPPNALIGPSVDMVQHAGKGVQHMPKPERAWSSLTRSYLEFRCQPLAPVLSFMLQTLQFTQIGLISLRE